MLVLSRKRLESIVIDPKQVVVGSDGLIRMTIVDVCGDRVRVGFDAPREVEIHRQEVWDRIHPSDN